MSHEQFPRKEEEQEYSEEQNSLSKNIMKDVFSVRGACVLAISICVGTALAYKKNPEEFQLLVNSVGEKIRMAMHPFTGA